jgi:hypothetical protein
MGRLRITRHLEFEADRLGASLCGHSEWLISALRKVSAPYTSEGGRIISRQREGARHHGRPGAKARSHVETLSTAPVRSEAKSAVGIFYRESSGAGSGTELSVKQMDLSPVVNLPTVEFGVAGAFVVPFH